VKNKNIFLIFFPQRRLLGGWASRGSEAVGSGAGQFLRWCWWTELPENPAHPGRSPIGLLFRSNCALDEPDF